jgi:four helix bundle protein
MNQEAERLKARTFTFALAVIEFCRRLRVNWEGRELSDQLFRSGTRVGANYRAACRGRSHKDFTFKIGHVVEEADETVYWLELIEASRIAPVPDLPELLDEARQLSRIFNQTQLTAKRNARRKLHAERTARSEDTGAELRAPTSRNGPKSVDS